MKCLIFSDSHGYSEAMKRIIGYHKDAEAIFFLGDGLDDTYDIAEKISCPLLAVRGNCDGSFVYSGGIAKKTDSITLMGKRIIFTHGDLYGVKYGDGGLDRLQQETDADIILFGHTHTPYLRYNDIGKKGVYYFNPGSVGWHSMTFGIMTISETDVLFSNGSLA